MPQRSHFKTPAEEIAYQHGFVCYHQERRAKVELRKLAMVLHEASVTFHEVRPSIVKALQMQKVGGLLEEMAADVETVATTMNAMNLGITYIPEQYRDKKDLATAWETGCEDAKNGAEREVLEVPQKGVPRKC